VDRYSCSLETQDLTGAIADSKHESHVEWPVNNGDLNEVTRVQGKIVFERRVMGKDGGEYYIEEMFDWPQDPPTPLFPEWLTYPAKVSHLKTHPVFWAYRIPGKFCSVSTVLSLFPIFKD
jgi:hypothetical protein